ncbi:MAG: Gfo/Idh/MocA family protein [Bdellovibrionales bacterium]
MKTLKTAVIGVGYLGSFHAQKHSALENVELIGVCDSSEARAKEIASNLKTEAYTDYKALLGKVDAVTIASATQTHYEIAKFFLENNTHVFVEKPISSSLEEAEELCKLADDNKLILQVGHIERFNPSLQAVKEKLKAKPLFIEVHRLAPFKVRATDVDVVLDLMIHDLDVILSLVGSEVKSVQAAGVPVLTGGVDIANARLEFESGTIANVTASRVSKNGQRKFRVFQENQYLSIDFGNAEVSLTTKTGDLVEGEDLPIEYDQRSLEKGDALLLETESFVSSVLNSTPPLVSGHDGRKALQLAEEISRLANARRD